MASPSRSSGVRWLNPGTLEVVCDRCGLSHIFEQVDFQKFILGNDNDDEFEILTPEDDRQYLHPQWVCRHHRCDNAKTIRLPPFKV
jgi:hypothetical protein